jgi:hypothetical protein
MDRVCVSKLAVIPAILVIWFAAAGCSEPPPLASPSALVPEAGSLARSVAESRGGPGLLQSPGRAAAATFQLLDVPGATNSLGLGINSRGDIVGQWGAMGVQRGFLWSGGSFTTIEVPGATQTVARGINARGDLVGFYVASGVRHGFLWRAGSFATIDVPGAASTFGALGINGAGDIVGGYTDGDGVSRGFLFRRDTFTPIDFPGAAVTQAMGINAAGDIVGFYRTRVGGPATGFVFRRGSYESIDFAIFAGGINASGDIVGAHTSPANPRGYLLRGGQFVPLGFPDGTTMNIQPQGINDRGDVVGSYFGSDGRFHVFVLGTRP